MTRNGYLWVTLYIVFVPIPWRNGKHWLQLVFDTMLHDLLCTVLLHSNFVYSEKHIKVRFWCKNDRFMLSRLWVCLAYEENTFLLIGFNLLVVHIDVTVCWWNCVDYRQHLVVYWFLKQDIYLKIIQVRPYVIVEAESSPLYVSVRATSDDSINRI